MEWDNSSNQNLLSNPHLLLQ